MTITQSTGGLIQIATSGKQDIYLTINPEITFFKKVFRRHTNISFELITINPEQPAEYNNLATFIVANGDAIHRCYIEIELPNLVFSDKYIDNNNYITRKSTDIANLTTYMNNWNNYYINLKGFVDIEVILYRQLYQYLQTTNISLNILKTLVNKFNYKYKNQKDIYKNKIEQDIFVKIDISGYISSITKLITNETIYDSTIYISRLEILGNLKIMYANMVDSLKYYYNKKIYYSNEITNKNNEYQINFNYAEYLGHNFFDYYTIEIGGQEIQKYSKDILHINQMHKIKEENMDNYLKMIGHTPELITFNNNSKGNNKILVPLIFWFNKDAGSSLPLVSLQYSTVAINVKVSELKKIICFENYEKMYDDIVNVTINATNGYILNENLIYNTSSYNIDNISINYNCLYINDELLKIKYPDLSTDKRNILLQNAGTYYTSSEISNLINNGKTYPNQYLINKNEWISFMLNINNPIYSTIAPIVGSYYPYIDFNLYYSLINNPSIKLICEYVYFDDLEREKFANSKLEYVIETFNEDIFDINLNTQNIFDCELSFYGPCKELLWYIQPQIYKDNLTENGQNINLLYDYNKYFTNSIILKEKLTFNQYDVLLNNITDNYYNYVLSYKFLNNILPSGIHYHSFSLYPEETQPSGTINFNQIKGKQYKLEINKNFLTEYLTLLNQLYSESSLVNNKYNLYLKFIAKCYDIFVIHKGTTKLVFNV